MSLPLEKFKDTSLTKETLASERKKARFSPNELGDFIYGKEYRERVARILKVLRAEPEIFSNEDIYFLNRSELIERYLKRERRLVELYRSGKIQNEDIEFTFKLYGTMGPYTLSRGAFLPAVEKQSNPEQIEKFVKPAEEYRIIGCYAQTELGHGSNVRGMETTITFVEETDEFEVNSPSLTSAKWWIGTMGVHATHAVVMGQLIIKGKNYGVFPIVVPLRSLEDHKPLPGVYIGDIGPKFGVNVMDNGYLYLDHVRVPRINLLQKYINVSRDGTFSRIKGADPRMTYISMVQLRTGIASGMGVLLARAVTVATRYTAVRRQFGKVGKPETPVLDYGIVQHRIIPLIAQAYAMIGMTHELKNQFVRTTDAIAKNDFSLLKEMHATSAGLKKWSTTISIYGIDTCRHVCGGHGYSQFSGLNQLFTDNYPGIIYEGDNYILAQQTTRYVLNIAGDLLKGSSDIENNDTTRYMQRFITKSNVSPSTSALTWVGRTANQLISNRTTLIDLLAYRLASMTSDLAQKIHFKGHKFEDSLVTAQAISMAHSEFIVALYFDRYLKTLPQSSPLAPILDLMFVIS
ncbi:putative peroxisomal acyl-coenzyme A oxidase, partial [Zancudomyces culisetae]